MYCSYNISTCNKENAVRTDVHFNDEILTTIAHSPLRITVTLKVTHLQCGFCIGGVYIWRCLYLAQSTQTANIAKYKPPPIFPAIQYVLFTETTGK